jgi:hypothetical protein
MPAGAAAVARPFIMLAASSLQVPSASLLQIMGFM